jgi:hypothetical protein
MPHSNPPWGGDLKRDKSQCKRKRGKIKEKGEFQVKKVK